MNINISVPPTSSNIAVLTCQGDHGCEKVENKIDVKGKDEVMKRTEAANEDAVGRSLGQEVDDAVIEAEASGRIVLRMDFERIPDRAFVKCFIAQPHEDPILRHPKLLPCLEDDDVARVDCELRIVGKNKSRGDIANVLRAKDTRQASQLLNTPKTMNVDGKTFTLDITIFYIAYKSEWSQRYDDEPTAKVEERFKSMFHPILKQLAYPIRRRIWNFADIWVVGDPTQTPVAYTVICKDMHQDPYAHMKNDIDNNVGDLIWNLVSQEVKQVGGQEVRIYSSDNIYEIATIAHFYEASRHQVWYYAVIPFWNMH
ncbi:hypothetical protein HDV00_005233 [Rhizophlyctis rosea]|nr:hypothetical protein HDV00_005233 [Rhizophlyctis rosea]